MSRSSSSASRMVAASRLQHAAYAHDQILEDLVERAVCERGVDEQLHAAHELGHALGLGARRLLAQERLALLLAAHALADIADEAGDERLALDLDLRDRGLGREARAVAADELGVVALHGHHLRRLDERPAALVVAVAVLLGCDERPERHADCIRRAPAEQPLRCVVPRCDHAVAVEGDEGIRRAVEHEPGARLALLERTRAPLRVLHAAAQHGEQARDQEPGDQRRPDREQPADHGARRLDEDQHHRVGDRDQGDVRERDLELEEVEGVQRGPRVEDGVDHRRLHVVVRERQDDRARREHDMQLPGPHAIGEGPDQGGDEDCDRREDHQLAVADLIRVREDEREQPQRRTREEEVGQRARLQTQVEKLRELPHQLRRLETRSATSRR